MRILINKDGKQLGPFSIEQARVLVVGGALDPEDWAWATGADDWVHLREVPGFTEKPAITEPPAPVVPEPAKVPVRQRTATPVTPVAVAPSPEPAASVAAVPVAATPTLVASAATTPLPQEETLWSGHPSQVLNLAIYIFWGFFLTVSLIVALMNLDTYIWIGLFAVVAVLAIGQLSWAYLHLRAIGYVVSTQRVRIISGLFSKDIKEIELFRVKDTLVRQSFFLRIFGLGTITVISGDERLPKLILEGVPDAINLRERLRTEVMNLRQRFGVRELDVM